MLGYEKVFLADMAVTIDVKRRVGTVCSFAGFNKLSFTVVVWLVRPIQRLAG
jgi:hypothetical protein